LTKKFLPTKAITKAVLMIYIAIIGKYFIIPTPPKIFTKNLPNTNTDRFWVKFFGKQPNCKIQQNVEQSHESNQSIYCNFDKPVSYECHACTGKGW
jgi:hypothetical protein